MPPASTAAVVIWRAVRGSVASRSTPRARRSPVPLPPQREGLMGAIEATPSFAQSARNRRMVASTCATSRRSRAVSRLAFRSSPVSWAYFRLSAEIT
jgi:hypothetical protein